MTYNVVLNPPPIGVWRVHDVTCVSLVGKGLIRDVLCYNHFTTVNPITPVVYKSYLVSP